MKRLFLLMSAIISACIIGTPLAFADGGDDQAETRDQNPSNTPTFTKLVADGWKGTFSPDGTKLAYGKKDRSGLVIRSLNDDTETEIAEAGKDAAWSPDGRWIAFVKEPEYDDYVGEEIWLVSPDGEATRKLADGGFPQWSADGKRVFFHSRRDTAIYSIDIQQDPPKPELFYDKPLSWYPAISPDETKIAFGRFRSLIIVEQATGETVFTTPTLQARGLLPAWSPDGRLLAYGGFNTDRFGIWVLDMSTNQTRQIAIGAYTMPSWSPDGSKLAFDYRADDREIWSIDVKTIQELLESEDGEEQEFP